ncbi:MAG: type II toxin-antitoxin system PemK/MazF family toxin [Candidatus Micrarchaeota archaeon]
MQVFVRGDVWLARWAKDTAESEIKARPAVIISNLDFNSKNEEVICLHLTTNLNHEYALSLDSKKDFAKCFLAEQSAIRYDIIARYSKKSLVKKLGILKNETLNQAVAKTIGLIKGKR